MSAWGTGTFDSDDAVDWLDGLQAVDDETLLQATLEAVEIDEGYVPSACPPRISEFPRPDFFSFLTSL